MISEVSLEDLGQGIASTLGRCWVGMHWRLPRGRTKTYEVSYEGYSRQEISGWEIDTSPGRLLALSLPRIVRWPPISPQARGFERHRSLRIKGFALWNAPKGGDLLVWQGYEYNPWDIYPGHEGPYTVPSITVSVI